MSLLAIEVRTYEGDSRELASFINTAWESYYSEDHWIPDHDAKCLDWQFFARRDESRDFRLAAYHGSRLVGCFLAECFPFEVNGRQLDGTIGTWFTIDPKFARTPAPFKLVNEMGRRHVERGKEFLLGLIFADRRAVAAKFWSAYARAFPQHLQVIGRCGLWIRVLNPRDVIAKTGDLAWRTGFRCLGMVQRGAPRWRASSAVRDYQPSDLDACLMLCEQESRGAALSHIWHRDRLKIQLGHPEIPRTLVVDNNGTIEGFLNYHCIKFRSRGSVPAGLIDLFVGRGLAIRDRVGLLSEATRRMLAEGIDVAIAPCFNLAGAQTMVACGYAPSPKFLQVASLFCSERIDLGNAPVQVLLR